tara:strand:+ start:430 stop:804 length:375 start_codon:yes stop_codon:yes gene_type:complete
MLLDSCVLIEFFQGGRNSEEIEHLLSTQRCFTSLVTLAEITAWCLREDRPYRERLSQIKKITEVLDLDEDIVELAGNISFERKKVLHNWGMLDSFIYASAQIYGLKLLTMDHHFDGLDGVEIWE